MDFTNFERIYTTQLINDEPRFTLAHIENDTYSLSTEDTSTEGIDGVDLRAAIELLASIVTSDTYLGDETGDAYEARFGALTMHVCQAFDDLLPTWELAFTVHRDLFDLYGPTPEVLEDEDFEPDVPLVVRVTEVTALRLIAAARNTIDTLPLNAKFTRPTPMGPVPF